jgi:hypothetical protein
MSAPVLVYDGGCPFCRSFAGLTELRGGIPGLCIVDGRSDDVLRRDLRARGYDLANGAILLNGDEVLHGAAAIGWICERMRPSDPLLRLLRPLFDTPGRARASYPLVLLLRRLALGLRGLPLDPETGA